MSHKRIRQILMPACTLIFSAVLIICAGGCSALHFWGEETQDTSLVSSEASVSQVISPTPIPTDTPTPTPTPAVKDIVVSFAGDCTFGQNVGQENNSNSFFQVVGTDYAYPFKNAVDVFSQEEQGKCHA